MKFLCLIAVYCGLVAATPKSKRSSLALSRRAHTVSPYTTDLKRKYHNDPHPRQLLRNRKRQTVESQNIVDDEQVRFLVPVTWGGQTLDAEFDTGSNDLWFVQSGFTCYGSYSNGFSDPIDESNCNFPNTYSPDGGFTAYANVDFRDCYGSGGRCVAGEYGKADVTIAGLEIIGQSVGAASSVSYKANGNGEQSGIVGASLASTGNNGYPSLFENLFVKDTFTPALDPEFSLAISRDASGIGYGGSLVIGGYPSPTDPRINASTTYLSTPFDLSNPSGSEYTFYGILLDGGFYTDSTYYDAKTQILIDSGNSGLDLPTDFANAFNSKWSPAVNSDGTLDCSAVPSDLWIGVGGGWLQINPADLISKSSTGICTSTVFASSSGPYWLGDPFLKNVIATFDWGGQQMLFYPRPNYES